MTRELYRVTGFSVVISPSLSVALEMQNKATGVKYFVSRSLPKVPKWQMILLFARIGSESVRLGKGENVPGWEWDVATVECRGDCSQLRRK